MKTSDRYRFSLQWGTETAEKVQAGEFLESLGNRKSAFVVIAVAEYLNAHPETLSSDQKFKIIVQPSYTREQIEAMVRNIMDEKITMPAILENGGISRDPGNEPDMEEMLKNLELFS